MQLAALAFSFIDLTTPGPSVRLRPLALFLAQRKPQNFLLHQRSLSEMFCSSTEPHLGEHMRSRSQALQADLMTHSGRRWTTPVINSFLLVGEFLSEWFV